jgi:hypothetical protein
MINSGKCPSCGQRIARVVVEAVDIGPQIGAALYKGVSYHCPSTSCAAVLGVQMDPIALKADTISGVVKQVRK